MTKNDYSTLKKWLQTESPSCLTEERTDRSVAVFTTPHKSIGMIIVATSQFRRRDSIRSLLFIGKRSKPISIYAKR
jgi:hypothetical protein